jgi:hypothetical protein
MVPIVDTPAKVNFLEGFFVEICDICRLKACEKFFVPEISY